MNESKKRKKERKNGEVREVESGRGGNMKAEAKIVRQLNLKEEKIGELSAQNGYKYYSVEILIMCWEYRLISSKTSKMSMTIKQ
ncbi:Hypothetical predicted protein [Octopus vulgaris]|uniref:Uncharacterized protein n=1 Tax=Octopus vulgaris TaxID=6645 RepID=A0AA36AHY1_OCTVU|nr:Hypothetical predicted protein [Octopus vulgaris]